MIEINLLPEEIKKKKRYAPKIDISKIDFANLPVMNIAFMIIGGLVAAQILLFAIGVVSGIGHSFLDKKYKRLLPEKQKTEKLKNQLNVMDKKVAAIDEIMVKHFSWAEELSNLSDSMIPGIWLTSLQYDEKLTERPKVVNGDLSKKKPAQENKPVMEKALLRYITISGAASSKGEEGTALIGRFIKSLKSNPGLCSDFAEIELGTIKREKAEDQEIMIFTITCLFKTK